MTTAEAKTSSHPKYIEMITAAIEDLKEKGGSSRLAILKYISAKYKVADNPNLVNRQLKITLKKGVASGILIQVKGTGASGSFKLNKQKSAAKPRQAGIKSSNRIIKPKTAKIFKKPALKVFKPKASKSLTKDTKEAGKKADTPTAVKSPKISAKKATMKPKSPKKPTKKSVKKPAKK